MKNFQERMLHFKKWFNDKDNFWSWVARCCVYCAVLPVALVVLVDIIVMRAFGWHWAIVPVLAVCVAALGFVLAKRRSSSSKALDETSREAAARIDEDNRTIPPIDHTQTIPVQRRLGDTKTIKEYTQPGVYLENGVYTYVERYRIRSKLGRKRSYEISQISLRVSDNERFVDPELILKAGFIPVDGETKIIAFKHPSKMKVLRDSWIAILLVVMVIAVFIMPLFIPELSGAMNYVALPGYFLLLLATVLFAWKWYVWGHTYHWATNKRLGKWIILPWPFRRSLDDVLHSRITNLDPRDQSAIGRYLGYGIIHGATAAGPNESLWLTTGMEFVTDFRAFYKLVTPQQYSKK